MIYLSRLKLDPRSRVTGQLLQNPYEIHRAISRAFPEDANDYQKARPLYRVETEAERSPLVIVQSRLPADWTGLSEKPLPLLCEPDQREVDLVFPVGRVLMFRLRANPCRHVRGEKRGERVPIWEKKPPSETANERNQRINRIEGGWNDWIIKKAESSGFSPVRLTVTPEGKFEAKNAQMITLNSVLYEGILRVIDPSLFLASLEAGIGPGKGFGFGLLSLAKV